MICDLHMWPVTRNQKTSNCFFSAVSNGFEHNSLFSDWPFSLLHQNTTTNWASATPLNKRKLWFVHTNLCVHFLSKDTWNRIDLLEWYFALLGDYIVHCSWKIKKILNVMDCKKQTNFLLGAQTHIWVICFLHFLNTKHLKANNASLDPETP